MSRLTVRLPETLHRQLTTQANREGVSLNQYIVYALTQQVTQRYAVHAHGANEVEQQQNQFQALLEALGSDSVAAAKAALREREQVVPEPDLPAEVVEIIRARLAQDEAAKP